MIVRCSSWLIPLLLAAPVVAQEPGPLSAWKHRARPLPSGLSPLGISVRPRARLNKKTVPLAANRDWDGWAKLLQERRTGEGLRSTLVRPAGPGPAMLGAWEDALTRLLGGPVDLLTAHRRNVDPLAKELITYTRKKHGLEAAWRAVVERYPASTVAADAARRLGERSLERGAVDVAQLWWRVAVRLGGPARPSRGLWLAARPGARDEELGVGPTAAPLRVEWVRAAPLPGAADRAPPRRAVAADTAHVYLMGADHLLAFEAGTGRLVWRRPRSDVGDARGLARAGDLLLAWGGRRLTALAAEDGRPRWTLDPPRLLGLGDDPRLLLTHVIPDRTGALVVARTGDAWFAVAVAASGKVTWRTTLWPCRSEPTTRNAAVIGGKVRLGTSRSVIDDGRLARLADRVFVTADGLVACLGRARGEVRWLRDRMVGLGLAGRLAVRVRLTAGAWGVTALTSAGLLTRLDPLDGSDRPALRTPMAPETPLLLSERPLVVGWKRGAALTVGVRGRQVGRLEASPPWPGAAVGGRLALPQAAGLRTFDLTQPQSAQQNEMIAWPLGPAHVEAVGRRLLLVNHVGIAVLTLGPARPAAPKLARDPLADLPGVLGHSDWRVRAHSRRLLLERLRHDAKAGASAVEQVKRASLEARVAVDAVRALAAREARWRVIAPKADPKARQRVLGAGSSKAIRALRPHLARTPAAAQALLRELLELPGTSSRLAAFDLLLLFDVPSQGRLVALVRTSQHPGAKRAACDALVRLGRAGGSTRPLEVLARHGYRQRDLTVFFALKAAGDSKLFDKVKPARLKQTLAQLRLVRGRSRLAPPDGAALIRELTPWIRQRH